MIKIIKMFKWIMIFILLISSNSGNLKFGKFFPNGYEAITYMYSSDGFWKPLKYLNYTWDKYSAGNSHILNPTAFNFASDKGQFLTCRDQEGHLLGDIDLDGELDSNVKIGYAFHRHQN